jgi:hypothetical protein
MKSSLREFLTGLLTMHIFLVFLKQSYEKPFAMIAQNIATNDHNMICPRSFFYSNQHTQLNGITKKI